MKPSAHAKKSKLERQKEAHLAILQKAIDCHRQCDYAGAIAHCEDLVAKGFEDWRLSYQHGNSLNFAGEYEQALVHLDKAIELNPKHAQSFMTRGLALHGLKRTMEAVEDFHRALEINPDFPSCYCNLGVAFESAGYYEEAVFCCKTALSRDPNLSEAWLNMGAAYMNLGEPDLARQAYDEAIARNPNFAEAHYNRSLCNMMAGNLLEGWCEYEWRTKRKNAIANRSFGKPRWSGIADPSKLVLVWPEQGIGDEIFFGTMLKDMIELQQNVVFEVDARLIPAFKRSFEGHSFIPRGMKFSEEIFDYEIPMGSLGQYLRPDWSSFRDGSAYLVPDRQRAAELREKIDAGQRLTIGISWISKNEKNGIFRSIPLRRLMECFTGFDVQLVSLQYGDDASTLSELNAEGAGIEPADFVDKFKDVEGLLSLIEACDLVISIDNSTVHFAGAIGKPAFVLLPSTPDWRWGYEGTTTPWYDSLRLFRQTRQNDWSSVIEDVRAALSIVFADETKSEPGN